MRTINAPTSPPTIVGSTAERESLALEPLELLVNTKFIDYDESIYLWNKSAWIKQSEGNVTGISGIPLGSDWIIDASKYKTRNICILGDSTGQRNTWRSTATVSSYSPEGPVVWMMCYLGWPWDFEPSDCYAISGYTAAQVNSIQLPLMLAAHATKKYERAFISVGTNDTFGGATVDSIKSDLMITFNTLRSVGIIPVHLGIKPRGADASLAEYKQKNMRINEWLYNLSLTGFIEYIDNNEMYADNSTAYSNSLTAYMTDNLHQQQLGAQLEGKAMAAFYAAKGYQPNIKFATMQADKFDRTLNINGVLCGGNPLLQGGTTAPTGFSSSGGTWSKVNRTLSNGQVRSDPTVAALASSTSHALYATRSATGAWPSTDLQPGDVIVGRSKVVVTGGDQISNIELSVTENNGVTNRASTCLTAYSSTTALLPGDHTLYLKTPRLTISAYGGSGNVNSYCKQQIVTIASAAGAFTVQALESRILTE